MNILIAGATGKTGLLLTQDLLDQGHTVTALVRESSDTSTLPERTDLRRGDLTDLQPGVCDGAEMRLKHLVRRGRSNRLKPGTPARAIHGEGVSSLGTSAGCSG